MIVRICDMCGKDLPPALMAVRMQMAFAVALTYVPTQEPKDFCGTTCLLEWIDQFIPGSIDEVLRKRETVAVVDGEVRVVQKGSPFVKP